VLFKVFALKSVVQLRELQLAAAPLACDQKNGHKKNAPLQAAGRLNKAYFQNPGCNTLVER